MSKLSRLSLEEINQVIFETQLKFYSNISDLSHKFSVESFQSLSTCVQFSRNTRIFANFTIEMIGNETGLLLQFVDLSRKLTNNSET